MKKSIITLLIICLSLLIPNGIFAEENEQEIDQNSTENKSIELYAEVTSTYTVKLPQRVDVTNQTSSFDIQVLGNISSDNKINVSFDSSAKLKDQSNKTQKRSDIDLTIENGNNYFTYDKLDTTYSDNATATITVKHTGVTIPAGSWSVELPVTISLIAA